MRRAHSRIGAPERPRGGVVTQRSAKPCTPVQFRAWPPTLRAQPSRQASDFLHFVPLIWAASDSRRAGTGSLRKSYYICHAAQNCCYAATHGEFSIIPAYIRFQREPRRKKERASS